MASDPVTRNLSMSRAIAEATVQAMEDDPTIFVMGVGVDDANGIFGTTKSAHDMFGDARVFDTPLSEPSLTGMGVGAAFMGMRPIMVHARTDFLLITMDQIVNHAAKWSYMSGGALRVPFVIRSIVGRGWGQAAQHSQSFQSLFAHIPGLQVVMPATAGDAKGLLISSLRGDMPVIFIEHRWLHGIEGPVPEARYAIPIGSARVERSGSDVTIVAISHMVVEARKAAELLATQGISAEVIDLRSIRPWDRDLVLSSVAKTGRLLVADTSWISFGVSAEIVASVVEEVFGKLKTSPRRIGLPPSPTPCAPELERAFYPDAQSIVASVLSMFAAKADLAADAPDGGEKPFAGHF